MAQSCISLAGSTACPAFTSASITTDPDRTGFAPFLLDVTDRQSFDTQLKSYVSTGYVQTKYIDIFGCSGITLGQTQDIYARYTMSVLCNAIVQSSIGRCKVDPVDAPPLCSDTCSDFTRSEQRIISTPSLCRSPGPNVMSQLRADITDCQIPQPSLGNRCIEGYQNEPDNCGFQSNLPGLCSFCRGSTVNSTDSCCITSNAESRCKNVDIPVFSSMRPIQTASSTPMTTTIAPPLSGGGNGQNSSSSGLTGGQIAGIVVGSVLGAILLLGLVICCCIFVRRRQQRQSSTLNQPTPPRSGEATSQARPPPFEALPGARVTRMTALEAEQDGSTDNGVSGESSGFDTSPESQGTGAAAGAAAGAIAQRKKDASVDESSPESGDYSSPDNGATQSERMSSFKDYYSSEEIHSGDLVSTLWAYQPRAPDEFELERGDMLKVVGIWDDGWATGVRISTRAGDWSPSQRSGRDSVVSSDSARGDSSGDGEIKAFPLVCVCLPQYWRATIEGEPSSPPPTD